MDELTTAEKDILAEQDALTSVLNVMANVSYQKKVTASGLQYSFAAIEDLVGQLRPAMIKARIALRKTEVLSHSMETFENANGKRTCCSTVHCRYTFGRIDLLDDEKLVSYEGVGYAQDTSDKAPAKAMTAALKVALRQGFLIEIGDTDPDKVRAEHVRKGHAGTDDVLVVAIGAIRGAKSISRVDALEKAALERPSLSDELSREMIQTTAEACRVELKAAKADQSQPEAKSLRGHND